MFTRILLHQLRCFSRQGGTVAATADPGLVLALQRFGAVLPLTVRPAVQAERYEILVGEPIFHAAKIAGLAALPAEIVEQLTDDEALELVQNAVTADPISEAESLAEQLGTKRARGDTTRLAGTLGISRTTLQHRLRLLQLPQTVREAIRVGALSAGHGKALCGCRSRSQKVELAERSLVHRWSVRKLERVVREVNARAEPTPDAAGQGDAAPEVHRLEQRLSALVGSPVRIDTTRMALTIDCCGSLDVLEGVLERLGYRED